MGQQVLAVARIVCYRLTDTDAKSINTKRNVARLSPNGAVVYTGATAVAGDILAAVVTAVIDPATANLQVFLDGDDQYWAQSRAHGQEEGQWQWPPRYI